MTTIAGRLNALLAMAEEALALAEAGRGLLESQQMEAFDDLWAKRRKLQKRFSAAWRLIQPGLERWPAELAPLAPAERQACLESRARLEERLRRLRAVDDDCKARLTLLLAQGKQELTKVASGKKMLRAYGNLSAQSPPKRLSKKG